MAKKKPCRSCNLSHSTCGTCGKERRFLDSFLPPGMADAPSVEDMKKLNASFHEHNKRDWVAKVTADGKLTATYIPDSVCHPKHYNTGKIEVIEFLEDQRLGYHLGNTVKYICRAGRKDPSKKIEDLEKALWYLRRKIERLKARKELREVVRPNDMNGDNSGL